MLSFRLGCSIAVIEQMRTTEFLEWIGFFEIHDQVNKSQIHKQPKR